jgi:hypothetical protein
MVRLRSWCWDHSLSLVGLGIGTVLNLVALPLPSGKAFDYLLTYGGSFTVVGLWGLLSGPLKEVNKPEEEPDL